MYLNQYVKNPMDGMYKISELLLDKLLKENIIKGGRNYQKFIILGWYRTGSNFFAYSVNSHPHILCYSEIFFPRKIFWGSGIYGIDSNDEKMINYRNEHPERFLNEYIFRNYSKRIKAVGFKIFYPQIENSIYRDLIKDLLNIQDLKIIHIKRKNYLNILVSHKIATKTGQRLKVNKADNINKSDFKLYLKPKECIKYFNDLDGYINKYNSVFKNHEMISIYYDDLVRNYNINIKKIHDILGVRDIVAHSLTQKQNQRNLSDIINNYDELKSYFRNSKWSVFF